MTAALVPSVNFSGTIIPRVVNERIRCPPVLRLSVILTFRFSPGTQAGERFLRDLLRFLAVNSSGNAHVVRWMLKQEDIDDLRIGSNGFVSDLDDVTDQLRFASLRKAGCDVTLNIRHSYLQCYFKRAIRSLSLALPSTNSGKCCPCSTKLMPRPSLMTKKTLSAVSPVASLTTRSSPAERARFCSSERPYRMSQEIIDIGTLLS